MQHSSAEAKVYATIGYPQLLTVREEEIGTEHNATRITGLGLGCLNHGCAHPCEPAHLDQHK